MAGIVSSYGHFEVDVEGEGATADGPPARGVRPAMRGGIGSGFRAAPDTPPAMVAVVMCQVGARRLVG